MNYPPEFSAQAKARVEKQMIRSYATLESDKQNLQCSQYGKESAVTELVKRCILDIFAAFSEEACQLGRTLRWETDRVKHECQLFLRSLTREVWAEKGHYPGRSYPGHMSDIPDMCSNIDGSIKKEVLIEFQQSDQWKKYQLGLSGVAEAWISVPGGLEEVKGVAQPFQPARADRRQLVRNLPSASVSPEPTESTGAESTCAKSPQPASEVGSVTGGALEPSVKASERAVEGGSGKADQTTATDSSGDESTRREAGPSVAERNDGASRRAVIDAFISKLAEAGRQVTRKDIWTVAGYKNATEFERFQRGDPRTTHSAASAFNRVLGIQPKSFIDLLDKKPSAQ